MCSYSTVMVSELAQKKLLYREQQQQQQQLIAEAGIKKHNHWLKLAMPLL